MTLLGAPREVYRVYGEEEFFARVERELSLGPSAGERIDAAPSAAGGRMLRRAVGPTLLLAVIGAVGGLVAMTAVPSSSRRGRRAGAAAGGARPLAATGSLVASPGAGVQVWRAPRDRVDPGGPLTREWQVGRGQAVRSAATATQRQPSPAGTLPAGAAASASGVTAPATELAASTLAARPSPAPSAGVAAHPVTAAPAQSPPQGQAEFGFER
jgi:hypothetical protein